MKNGRPDMKDSNTVHPPTGGAPFPRGVSACGRPPRPYPSRVLRTLTLSLSLSLSLSLAASPVDDFLNPDLTHSAARRALVAFPDPLPAADLEAGLAFLKKRFDHTEEELLIVRQNDLADRLLQRSAATVPTARVLLEVIADESADILWREYCLQKLPLAHEQDAATPGLKADLVAALRERSTDPAISFSGTSLLGLYRLREEAAVPAEELIERAALILEGREYATSNKVTALQIAVLLGDENALAQARRLAADSRADIQLRVSAVASIGQRGGPADLATLAPLADSPDYRLRLAARAALKRLRPSAESASR